MQTKQTVFPRSTTCPNTCHSRQLLAVVATFLSQVQARIRSVSCPEDMLPGSLTFMLRDDMARPASASCSVTSFAVATNTGKYKYVAVSHRSWTSISTCRLLRTPHCTNEPCRQKPCDRVDMPIPPKAARCGVARRGHDTILNNPAYRPEVKGVALPGCCG